jgi:maltose alpha-D-glucosyltransferase/alpha-amylase
MANNSTKLDDHLHWYKDAIIYELHIKAFRDSNGDGIGDFGGLLEKLDYLQDLGVTAVWVLPFYPSPLRDDGYDIKDYYTINPSYGKLKDFKKFLKEAHKRNLKVITELVINHTSDQHPWFQRARRAKPGSPERDYYVWSDTQDQFKDVRIIFQDFESSNWTWDPVAKAYFWHRFYSHQPDLNFDNPQVQQEVFNVLDYWIDLGVDGFRLDAVPYLFEREGTNCENLPETHVFLKKLRKHVEQKKPSTLLLAEANMWPEDSAAYFGDGDECHMNYHFPIMPRMFMALRMEDRYPITDILDQTPEIPATCQWGIFLRNHDELTLEMVTDEERDYMYKVYTKDPLAKINLGIRHRLAPLLDNDRRKIELMNHLLFSLPGSPVIYYGDEIGMGDNFYLGDRNGVRTPMQWSADRNAGFSSANPQQLYLPVILDPEYQYESVNVDLQQRNSNSILWWMKRHISMRKNYKAFGRGDIHFLPADNAKVLAFTRTYEDQTILVLANLSRFSQAVELDLQNFHDFVPKEVFSKNRFPVIRDYPYLFTLSPYGYQWFLLEQPEVPQEVEEGDSPKVLMKINQWKDLLKGRNKIKLEDYLPTYLMKCRWFGGKARTIQGVSIIHQLAIQSASPQVYLLIIEVSYNEGLNELYQLPISFVEEGLSDTIRSQASQALIVPMTINEAGGYLFDAVYNENFRNTLFDLMVKGKKIKENGTELHLKAQPSVNKWVKKEKPDITSKVLNAEQSNTSVIYSQKYFLKFYRKVDNIINPDLEITRFLTETAKFEHVPQFAGSFSILKGRGEPLVLAMMQEMIENQGDAWGYMKDVISRYYERVSLDQIDRSKVPALRGSLTDPVTFEKLPEELKTLLSGIPSERASLLGVRTAEMHIALGAHPEVPDFGSENFSLHYQRSLYSSLQSLVRSAYQSLDKQMKSLPEEVTEDANRVKSMRKDILKCMQRIYRRKMSSTKIRAHGDYHLGQVLFTGKDFVIIDFEGEPARPFSERRLKRSPLRDVAGMVRSFHYAAYSGLFENEVFKRGDADYLEEWAELWYHYMSGFYIHSYLETAKGYNFLPDNQEDFNTLIQTFLLEKAVYELNYELNNRPNWAIIPMRGIQYVMQKCNDNE